MKLPLVLTLLCFLSTSLAGTAHSPPAASQKIKAAKTTATQAQGTAKNPCADAAKCSPVFVPNPALAGDAYKTYRPVSLPTGTVSAGKSASSHQSTSAHGTSHKAALTTVATSVHKSSPSKDDKHSPSSKSGKPSPIPKSKKPSPTPKSKKPSPTPKKSHARRAEDDPEIFVTNNDTALAAVDSSELVRRHGRDWSVAKRTEEDWSGIEVPQGGLDFAPEGEGIYTKGLKSCSAVLANHDKGTVLAHLVCADSPQLHNPFGSVNDQYAKLNNMVTLSLGPTDIVFWVFMPAESDNGFAQVKPVLDHLRRDFPLTSRNSLNTANRAAEVSATTVWNDGPPYILSKETWGGLAWQPANANPVQFSQTEREFRWDKFSGLDIQGYPKRSDKQPPHPGFTVEYWFDRFGLGN